MSSTFVPIHGKPNKNDHIFTSIIIKIMEANHYV